MPLYQGPLERRARRWFSEADSAGARAVRVFVLFTPLALAILLGVPTCPSAALLHLPCPGCGLTRATLALMRGDFAAATALQPLAVVICPLLCGALLYALARYVLLGKVQMQKWRGEVILIAATVALTAVWVARWFGLFGGPVPV